MSTKLEGMPSNILTADSFAGKKVIDREGIQYGKVKHIHIHQDTLRVSGITVHQGFHRDYYLPEGFIDKFTEETILLSTPPITKGAQVVDIDGHKIGKVRRLLRNSDTNELEAVEITDGVLHTRIMSKTDIWGVGEKVILRMKKEELKKQE